jgi:Ca2+-binding RTX toxin-like protein
MAFYTASSGTTSYTGTADDDYFRFDTEFDAQNFDIGTTVDGGGGTDKVTFSFRSSYAATTITVDLDAGFSVDGVTYVTFTGVENVDLLNTPSTQSYTLNGTSGANTLAGDSGNDTINGLGGNDILSGGEGTNVLNGGAGNDRLNGSYYTAATTMNGGTGDDTYSILVAGSDTVVERADEGTDTVESRVSYTLGANVENLTLASGYNEYGPDTVLDIDATGNSLGNVIIGNSDANIITAGAGNDTLTGNGGGDTYVFASGDGSNVITDFDHDLDTLDFSAFSASDQALLANPVSNDSGQSVYTAGAFSVSVPELPQAPNNDPTGNVEITGTSTIGGTLTADMSGVEDDDGLGEFTYQWLRDGATISGATGNTLTLGTGDANSNISVNVYYTDGNDYAEFLSSEPVPVTGAVIQVTTTADVVNANDGVTSLREAVTQANAAGGPAVIELGSKTYQVSGETLTISGDVEIRGNGAGATTILDSNDPHTFHVESGAALDLTGLTLDGSGYVQRVSTIVGPNGLPIVIYIPAIGSLDPNRGFRAEDDGGAIFNDGGAVTIQNAEITNFVLNQTVLVGMQGGTDAKSGAPLLPLPIMGPSEGGAIFNQSGTIDISASTLSDNKAAVGGAIFVAGGTVELTDTQLTGNSAYSRSVVYDSDPSNSKSGLTYERVPGESPDIHSAPGGQVIIDGVGQASDPASASERLASADLALAREAAAEPATTSAPDQAVLDVRRRTDLSLDDLGDSAFALVDDGILSEGGRKIVVQLASRRIVLEGKGLSLDGDPYDLSTAELLGAVSGTITKLTLRSKDGSRVLSTMTGLDVEFEDVVISLLEIDVDNPPSMGDLLGVRLKMSGTARNDVLEGTEANDRIDGEGGNDRLFGNGGKDVLLGGEGRDTLDAGTGGGKDILDGGAGADRMVGRDGKTIYIVDDAGDIVEEYGSEGNDEVRASISYTLGNTDVTGIDNIENLRLLGQGDINGTGNDLDNVITGNKGDNQLDGGDGDDKIIGGKGNDMLIGGQGHDTFVFSNGSGQDTIRDFDATDNQEQINLKKVSSVTGFNDLRNNHMEQLGDDVLIDLGRGNTITLLNVDITDLGSGDFLF